MRNADRRWVLLAILIVATTASPTAQQQEQRQQKPLFTFHSNAWFNLHQFVRLVARGGPPPTEVSQLSDQERTQWSAGIEFYAPYAKRDVLFDQGMVDIGTALRRAEGKTNLDGITLDAALKTTLERLMPIYQKHWWPAHDRGNREWIKAVQPLIDRHGAAISQALARTYGVTWPNQPIPVDLTVTAGPNGAYSAGELTKRELKVNGIDYNEYAAAGLYQALCGAGCREKIAEHWTPHLDGKRSIPDAVSALVTSFK
jgi:hypothetical protein